MHDRHELSRRRLLKAGAATALAFGTAGALGGRAYASVGSTARFDLAAPGTELFTGKALHNVTVQQSFAFDNVNQHVYFVQVMAGGQQLPGEPGPVSGGIRALRGDMCLTRLDLAGNKLGHMFLKGFGHGVQIGVEPVGSSAFLWTEVDAVSDDGVTGWGSQVARFRFDDGAILTPDSEQVHRLAPIPGADRTTVAIDPAHNRLTMRHRLAGSFRYALYDLDEVRRNRFQPLATVAQPTLTYSFQGFATFGQYLYLLEGTAYGTAGSVAPVGNTYLTAVDWTSGAVVDRQLVTDAATLSFREPEGMAIQIPDQSRPHEARLCFGFASGVAGARRANIVYKQALV